MVAPRNHWETEAAAARKLFQEQAEELALAEGQDGKVSGRKWDQTHDKVEPSHYKGSGMEVIDVIDAFDLDLYQGSIVQYIIRFKNKDGIVDLKKAKWYLERLIQKELKRVDNKRTTTTTTS